MATRPLPAAATVPTTKGPTQPAGRSPRSTSVSPFHMTAPSVMGTRRRNETFAADSRSRPRKRAAEIVTPDLETPGASASTQATRSSFESTRRFRRLRIHACRRSTIVERKYTTTATSVPRWRATSNVWLNSSFLLRNSQSASHGTRMRCPEEEMGRSSVRPWTTPRTNACQSDSAPARSPTPTRARAAAARRAAEATRRTPTRRIPVYRIARPGDPERDHPRRRRARPGLLQPGRVARRAATQPRFPGPKPAPIRRRGGAAGGGDARRRGGLRRRARERRRPRGGPAGGDDRRRDGNGRDSYGGRGGGRSRRGQGGVRECAACVRKLSHARGGERDPDARAEPGRGARGQGRGLHPRVDREPRRRGGGGVPRQPHALRLRGQAERPGARRPRRVPRSVHARELNESPNGAEGGIDILRPVRDARAKPDELLDVRRHARDDSVPRAQHVDGLAGRERVELEADDPGRELVREGRDHVHAGDLGQSFLQAAGELVRSLRDSTAADATVELERIRKRPAVLEGVEPPWRHRRAGREVLGRAALEPGAVARAVEGRDGGARLRPR